MASGCETDRSGRFGTDGPPGGAGQVRVTLFQPLQWDTLGHSRGPIEGQLEEF